MEEAETEEDEGIRWKKRKLKRRLLSFRQYLFENYNLNTVTLLFREIVFIYRYYEIEVLDLPKLNKKAALTSEPITFNDLPDKEIIRMAINIASPVMKPIIYFMASSGCARTETLNLTIKDYINSLSDYTNKTDIYEVISEIDGQTNVVPTFKILRQKTKKYYTTYCSPEAVNSINIYLLSRKDVLTDERPLFKIDPIYFNINFHDINDELGLGKKGCYSRFRSHMLHKFHASAL